MFKYAAEQRIFLYDNYVKIIAINRVKEGLGVSILVFVSHFVYDY